MPGKINVYNLGEHGVNVVKSPIHLDDGELLEGRNCVFRRSQSLGGLAKRGGISQLNSSAMTGAVRAAIDVPLPDPSTATRYLYAGLGSADANNWTRSVAGSSWAAVTNPSEPTEGAKQPVSGEYFQRALSFRNKLWYPGNDYTQYSTPGHGPPTLHCWDGTNDIVVARIPYNPTSGSTTNALVITDIWLHRGAIYISCYDPGGAAPNHRGRVFKLDPSTLTLAQVGNRFGAGTGEAQGGMPFCGCSYLGRLWIGTMGIAGAAAGKVYSISPVSQKLWVLEHTTTVGEGYIMSLGAYRGELYAATMADAGATARLKKRTTAGAWSNSDSGGGGATTGGYYASIIVFEDELYCTFIETGAGNKCLIRKYNGSAWSTSLDVGVTYAVRNAGQPYIYKSDLYWAFVATGANIANNDGFILKKAAGGGAWSQVLTSANIRSHVGSIRIDV